MSELDLILPGDPIVLPKPKAATFLDHSTAYGGATSTLAITADIAYWGPFAVPYPIAVDQVAIEVTVAAAAGKSIRVGLMQFDPATPWKIDLLSDIAALLADTTGAKTNAFAYTFVPGLIYAPIVNPEASATIRSVAASRNLFGGSSGTDTTAWNGLAVARAYSALPSTLTGTSRTSCPRVMFRVA